MRNDLRSTLLALACACAAACGGGGSAASSQQSAPRGPLIITSVADALAAQADAVAASLDAHHDCAARAQAGGLATAIDAAIAAGQIPAALQPQLQATSLALGAAIRCTPPPPKPPGHKHHHGKDNGNGQGDGGD
jgi:hypothetical protein